ncbi:MAG: hypothetical protein LBB74_01455 [Chitinispirillales bacterium]|jgi:hypothetical protein|nr:hypothetical protein [Chitinispirillales bacterium]
MLIRGGGKSKSSSGNKKCDFLNMADDQSLLLKNPVSVCKSYKLEYLQDPSGKIQTRCQWAEVEGKAIFCKNSKNL